VRKANGVDLLRIAKLILSVLVLSIVGMSTIANAAFFGLPKALKAPLDQIELSMPNLEPKVHDLFGIDYLDLCQLENEGLFRLPKTLTHRFDRISSEASSPGDRCSVKI